MLDPEAHAPHDGDAPQEHQAQRVTVYAASGAELLIDKFAVFVRPLDAIPGVAESHPALPSAQAAEMPVPTEGRAQGFALAHHDVTITRPSPPVPPEPAGGNTGGGPTPS